MPLRLAMLRLGAALSILAAAASGPVVAAAPAALPQAGFVVNTLNDLPDANLGNPLCETSTLGQCSYRAALQQANATAGPDTITFNVTGSIISTSPEPVITDSLSIQGPGAALLTLDANGVEAVVRISNNNEDGSYSLSGLTLTGGIHEGSGGGVSFNQGLNRASLVIADTVITGNLSITGGGVYADGPTQIINRLISHNQATLRGAGVDAEDPLEVINSTIQENHQEAYLGSALADLGVQGSGEFTGGGLAMAGPLTMTNSLVLSNTASSALPDCAGQTQGCAAQQPAAPPPSAMGAGLYLYRSHVQIQTSVIAGNYFIACLTCTVSAGAPIAPRVGHGAGVFNEGGLVILLDSQVLSNTAQDGAGLAANNAQTALVRTLVAHNLADDAAGLEIAGGAVTMTASIVQANAATLGTAGGLYAHQAAVAIHASAFVHNHAALDAGGLYLSQSSVIIDGSLIQENASGNASPVSQALVEPQIQTDSGGGLYNYISTITISDTAIVSNTATQGGGLANGGALTLRNVTLSGNTARRDGGGMFSFVPGALAASGPAAVDATGSSGANLLHVTLANNTADFNNDGTGDGGGLFLNTGTTATLHSTLLATNVDLGGQRPECAGTVTSTGYNLIQSTTGCTVTATTGDQFNVLSGLLPLQANGGQTLTQGLAFGSLALNVADPAVCLPRDQRGAVRPFGPGCDIGAFEMAGLYLPIVTR